MTRAGRRSLLLVLAMLIASSFTGCGAATEISAQDVPAKAFAVRDRMHDRFAATRRLELAIASSQLEAARAEAGVLARLDEPDLLPAWQPYVEQIRASAREIEQTPDLVAAAMTSAVLGQRCAGCHEATAARLAFAKEAGPPGGAKLASRMASHQWAAARLWEGLIGPSPESWLDGARALAGAPLAIIAEGDDRPPGHAVADDVSRIRLLATRAMAAQTPDDRTALYGELLSTCVRCHVKIRDR